MTDRAQDTEAIRAAHRTELIAISMGARPKISALEALAFIGEYDRLVARLEAAERHERALRAIAAICTPEKHVPFIDRVAEIRRTARAALAAAAPGETEPTP